MTKITNMLDVAMAHHAAKATLAETWRHSLFYELLVANLRSERLRVVEPPEWYGDALEPEVGHGCRTIELKYAVKYAYDESVMNVGIVVTYTDGTDTKEAAYDIHPPTELFHHTTKSGFAEWAKKERSTWLTRKHNDALKVLDDLKKRIGWAKP